MGGHDHVQDSPAWNVTLKEHAEPARLFVRRDVIAKTDNPRICRTNLAYGMHRVGDDIDGYNDSCAVLVGQLRKRTENALRAERIRGGGCAGLGREYKAAWACTFAELLKS